MTNSLFVKTFSKAVKGKTSKPKHPPPFSIRFTDEERAILDHQAGVLSLAAYIRLKLFSDLQEPPPKRRKQSRRAHTPSAELAVLGNMLGGLGKSRLASNLNQIAKAANVGALPVSPELEQQLWDACAEIQAMREELIFAIGIKSQ